MALKYLAGERIIGTAAERAAMTTSVSAVPQTSWKELGRYTLTSGSTSIRVGTGTQTGSGTGTGNFTAKDNLMVLIHAIGEGETMHLRLGSSDTVDDDPNYAFRITHNGSDGSSADGKITLNCSPTLPDFFADSYFYHPGTVSGSKHKIIAKQRKQRQRSG